MKRYLSLLIIALLNLTAVAQETGDQAPNKTDLPTIMPPSPTVTALMRFEEVPVSNYTGIPDISIPLFSTATLSSDINLDISLKYHPAGVAVEEKASDIGLGWSLFAGGTISRTVNGLPDEILDYPGVATKTKVGIYQNQTSSPQFDNKYYEFLNVTDNFGSNLSYDQKELRKEFLFEAHEKGIYDTNHDLWQFNFMGHSGRFYIEKNTSTGLLEVKALDNYNLKIINNYGNADNLYTPTSFIIYDDKGYKYEFDVVENTVVSTSSSRTLSTFSIQNTISNPYAYNSSFHLSRIVDANGQTLIVFTYSADEKREIAIDKSNTNNYPRNFIFNDVINLAPTCESITKKLEPDALVCITQRNTTVKKLESIEVKGKAIIAFNFQQGRSDTNLHNPNLSYFLKGIDIKDFNGNNKKAVQLEQFYSTVIETRMMLRSVKFKNFLDDKVKEYTIDYRFNENLYNQGDLITKDLWGYYKKPNFIGDRGREVNPSFCTTETIQKLNLPTGGCMIFDFESNTYSYNGSMEISNFDDNPSNFSQHTSSPLHPFIPLNNGTFGCTGCNGTKQQFFTINEPTDVYLSSEVISSSNQIRDYAFTLYQVNGSNYIPLQNILGSSNVGLTCYDCQSYHKTDVIQNIPAGTYAVSFNSIDTNLHQELLSATITATYKIRNSNNYQFLYAGGNRIRRIGYFSDGTTNKNIYQEQLDIHPDKEKNYDYTFFEHPQKTSGSLVGVKPIYTYPIEKRPCIECENFLDTDKFTYDVYTSLNNTQPIKTQGADVGYQNVTVYERGNGKTRYLYNSPIDFPYDSTSAIPGYPFLMDNDEMDPYRGVLRNETVYSETAKISETIYEYQYEIFSHRTGLKTRYINDLTSCPISGKYATYELYKKYVRHCAQNMSNPEYTPASTAVDAPDGPYTYNCYQLDLTPLLHCPCFCYCGEPDDFIGYIYMYETYGWAKLTNKTTFKYFYDATNSLKTVQTDETYTYNPINKKIEEQTVSNSLGEITKTKYFYLQTLDNETSKNNIAQIEKVEVSKNNVLLSSNHITYATNWEGNQSYLPSTIETAKSTTDIETRVRFTKYDTYGHPLELQHENGTFVSYIWGYNDSQPIAKIENARYDDINPTLIQNAKHESQNSVTGLEVNLVNALNAVRAALPDAMVTTYTYIPLVGVAAVTDSRGYQTTYDYDSFGNLSAVYDAAGNQISTNEYHYRTQN